MSDSEPNSRDEGLGADERLDDEAGVDSDATHNSDATQDSEDNARNTDNGHPNDNDHPTEAATVMGTRAVPFDPFADDDDDDEIDIDINDIGSLLQSDNPADTPSSGDGVTGPGPGSAKTVARPRRADGASHDPSQASRDRALSTFRERRAASRRGKAVADGMVSLPFIVPTDPRESVMDSDTIKETDAKAPSLHKGDMVAGQYEVVGALANGGVGWIYLAIDHYVSDRWVVLKGMKATANEQDRAVAGAERAFLADITHTGIVKIYNFVDDDRSPAGSLSWSTLVGRRCARSGRSSVTAFSRSTSLSATCLRFWRRWIICTRAASFITISSRTTSSLRRSRSSSSTWVRSRGSARSGTFTGRRVSRLPKSRKLGRRCAAIFTRLAVR